VTPGKILIQAANFSFNSIRAILRPSSTVGAVTKTIKYFGSMLASPYLFGGDYGTELPSMMPSWLT